MFAATKAICTGLLPIPAGLVNKESPVVGYRTAAGTVVSARVVPAPDGVMLEEGAGDTDFYVLELSTHGVDELQDEESERVKAAVAKALRKPVDEVGVKFMARGGRGAGKVKDYLVVVLDENEELEGRDIDISALVGPKFILESTYSVSTDH